MALFGDKKSDKLKNKLSKLERENEDLKEQLAEYEKVFGNFEDMKKVTDRVREENKRLLEKLEENVEVKSKMQKRIDELTQALNAKKEDFQLNISAMESKDDNIVVGNNVEFTGGLSTPKNITTGDNVVIQGDVNCNEKVSLGNYNRVVGNVAGDAGVLVGNGCQLEKNIVSQGPVSIGEDCRVSHVSTDADVQVGKNTEVKKITSGANVYLKEGVHILDGIEYKGSINIEKDVTIAGEIKTRQ